MFPPLSFPQSRKKSIIYNQAAAAKKKSNSSGRNKIKINSQPHTQKQISSGNNKKKWTILGSFIF